MSFNIKNIREKMSMSQEELARKSSVSRATISAIENNPDAITTTETLQKLASALGVKVSEFFCD